MYDKPGEGLACFVSLEPAPDPKCSFPLCRLKGRSVVLGSNVVEQEYAMTAIIETTVGLPGAGGPENRASGRGFASIRPQPLNLFGARASKRQGSPEGLLKPPLVEGTMAKLGIAIATALLVCAAIPASAAALECKHTPAEYAEAVRHLEAAAAKARMLAEQNPLYESDVAYYGSVLRDTRACAKMLAPVVSASR
jgi:hypothetical protein